MKRCIGKDYLRILVARTGSMPMPATGVYEEAGRF